jgi:hypothetical protein
MIKTAALLFVLLLTGCATGLTPEGRGIKVIYDNSPGVVAQCERLSLVTGESASFLSGGDYGLFYATTDARNKAARIPEADTLVITDNQGQRFGGEVTGIAYICNPQRARPVQKATAPEVRKAPVTAIPRDDIFEKAKKCQYKGGVWVNNQCVIPID